MSAVRRVRDLVILPPEYDRLRLTIPGREALLAAGNDVMLDDTLRSGVQLYRVTLRRPPAGIGQVLIGHDDEQHTGLRMHDEPAYPLEWRQSEAVAWHEHGQWVPCPTCGAALVWYEAGYVPGYRACVDGHHAQLSADGRSARAVRA